MKFADEKIAIDAETSSWSARPVQSDLRRGFRRERARDSAARSQIHPECLSRRRGGCNSLCEIRPCHRECATPPSAPSTPDGRCVDAAYEPADEPAGEGTTTFKHRVIVALAIELDAPSASSCLARLSRTLPHTLPPTPWSLCCGGDNTIFGGYSALPTWGAAPTRRGCRDAGRDVAGPRTFELRGGARRRLDQQGRAVRSASPRLRRRAAATNFGEVLRGARRREPGLRWRQRRQQVAHSCCAACGAHTTVV